MFLFQVKKLIVSDNFKPNCALVIVDFLIRWGFVRPDNGKHLLNKELGVCEWRLFVAGVGC